MQEITWMTRLGLKDVAESIAEHPHGIQYRSSKKASNETVPPGTAQRFPRRFASDAKLFPMSISPSCLQVNAVPGHDPFQQRRDLGGLYVEVSYKKTGLTFTHHFKFTRSSIKQQISQPKLLSIPIGSLVPREQQPNALFFPSNGKNAPNCSFLIKKLLELDSCKSRQSDRTTRRLTIPTPAAPT